MARLGKVITNEKRKKLVARYAEKRAALKSILASAGSTPEDKESAQRKLQALPRNANPTRIRNRCLLTGRPRGFLRKFQMSRIALRQHGLGGDIPGLVKSSW